MAQKRGKKSSKKSLSRAKKVRTDKTFRHCVGPITVPS
jgi:hypothetical protein